MFSKLIKPLYPCTRLFLIPKFKVVQQSVTRYGDLIPPTQYDTPIPRKLQITYALRQYWELIPLFLVVFFGITNMLFAIAWAYNNKVDVVYSTHSRRSISRTMDLRNPSVHKILTINQRYDPWPEMQDALDKMMMAEKRALVRLQTCSHA